MVASRDLKDTAGIGIGTLLHILDPGAVYGEGHVVFRLAGHGAGVTADALTIVDDESVSHQEGGPWKPNIL